MYIWSNLYVLQWYLFKTNNDIYLEEEHKRNPLVVGMVARLVLALNKVSDTWMCDVSAYRLVLLMRQCERVRDPAIRVYHVTRNSAVWDAGYRVSYKQRSSVSQLEDYVRWPQKSWRRMYNLLGYWSHKKNERMLDYSQRLKDYTLRLLSNVKFCWSGWRDQQLEARPSIDCFGWF